MEHSVSSFNGPYHQGCLDRWNDAYQIAGLDQRGTCSTKIDEQENRIQSIFFRKFSHIPVPLLRDEKLLAFYATRRTWYKWYEVSLSRSPLVEPLVLFKAILDCGTVFFSKVAEAPSN